MDEFEYAMGGSPETNPFSLSDYSIGTIILVALLIIVLIINIISFIKFYKKMGYNGLKAIVPVYNFMILAEMGDMKKVMGLLFLIPIVNFIFLFKAYKSISKKMSLSGAYPILLTLLPFIFIPLIAFNKKIVCAPEYMHSEEVIENLDTGKVTDLNALLGQDSTSQEQSQMQNNMQVNQTMPQTNNDQMLDPNMLSNNMNNQMMNPNMMQNNMQMNQGMVPNNMNGQMMDPNMMQNNMQMNQGMMSGNTGQPNNGVFDPNSFGNN